MSTFTPKPDLPPPRNMVGVVGWMRANLFNSIPNVIMTFVGLYVIWLAVYWIVDWGILKADFVGDKASDCSREGACWVFVRAWMDRFIYGFYPDAEMWRVNVVFALAAVLVAALIIEAVPHKGKIALFALTGFPVIAFFLLHGGYFGLEVVETEKWGGLMLTLVLAVVGIVASFPIGIMFALGRRSDMPIIRSISIVYIEFWRGVPLITVLFMASVMLPLFMTEGTDLNKLIRAMIGITLFQGAYMAEVVRGGLQAIPKGQYEAADALGLSYWQKTGLVILPQALKLMIPGIVNTFIALFKDTSLVLIIGLFDLLSMVQSALTNPDWPGFATEGYLFAGFVFWIFCFGMSRYSQRLEAKLNTSHR